MDKRKGTFAPRRKASVLAQSRELERALKAFSSHQSAIEKAMAAFAKPSAIENALEDLRSHQSAIDEAMASFTRPSVPDSALKDFSSHRSAIANALASLAKPSTLESALKDFCSHPSAIYLAMAPFAVHSDWESASKIFRSHQALIDKVAGSYAIPSALKSALETYRAHQSAIDKAIGSLATSQNLEKALSSFGAASAIIIQEPDLFSKLVDVVSSIKLQEVEIGNLEENLKESTVQLGLAEDQETFFGVFLKLHPFVQAVLFYFLMHVFLPQINSISANLLTPIVENYLEKRELTEREQIRHIRNLPLSFDDVNTDGLRFITANNVRLRAEPSTKSDILDEMVLGQVVTVLSKKKNWIEVMYKYKDGESLSGWVFNRYTAKFVK